MAFCTQNQLGYCVPVQLDNPDPSMAKTVAISYKAFLDANMWMGFGYSMDGATEVSFDFRFAFSD